MTQFAAIPTTYNDVQFRSRLEARWAAFFDLCGWQWEYEPFDLNGWIPDFMLRGAKTNTLVEVKPLDWNVPTESHFTDETEITSYLRSFPDLAKVFDKSDHEVLICGACLPADPRFYSYGDDPPFAAFAVELCGPSFALFDYCDAQRLCDFYSGHGDYRHRISGEYDGDHHLYCSNRTQNILNSRWKRAGNVVQWKGPRK